MLQLQKYALDGGNWKEFVEEQEMVSEYEVDGTLVISLKVRSYQGKRKNKYQFAPNNEYNIP